MSTAQLTPPSEASLNRPPLCELAPARGSASYGAVMAMEDCRGWLLLKVAGGGDCMTTAGDVLDELRNIAEDPDRFWKAVTGQ